MTCIMVEQGGEKCVVLCAQRKERKQNGNEYTQKRHNQIYFYLVCNLI